MGQTIILPCHLIYHCMIKHPVKLFSQFNKNQVTSVNKKIIIALNAAKHKPKQTRIYNSQQRKTNKRGEKPTHKN